MSQRVPGPPPLPIIGALGNLVQFRSDPLGYSQRVFRSYGPLATLVDGPARLLTPRGTGVVLATGPELNRQVLTQHDRFHTYALSGRFFPEDDDRPRLRPLKRMMTGLFHVNGDEHRRHRRLLMPAFHKARLEAYRDDMVELVGEMLDGWRPGQATDLSAEMTRLTLRVATKTLFGDDVGESGVKITHWMQDWLLTMFSLAALLPWDLPGLPYRRWLDRSHQIDAAMSELVRRKRAQGTEGADMLSMLLAARDEDGSQLTDDEIIGHAGVIFAAGHETSANALTWTLLLLSQHPKVASSLGEELAAELHGDAPTTEQLTRLPLLDAVVKESLRVLPPVPLHPRFVSEPVELGGYHLPAYTEIFLSIYNLHHDPALFPDPQSFLPSRWASIRPSTFEYNPFSAGPRMCIGAAFAMMEIKIALAMILQRFRIAPVPQRPVNRRVAITMAPTPAFIATVKRQDGNWQASAGGVAGNVRELVSLPA